MNISIEKPDFKAGSIGKFLEFFSKIKKEDSLALISHIDLDGIVSTKITNEIFHTDLIKFVDYPVFNLNLLEDLKLQGVKNLVITDLYVKDEELINKLNEFENVLIIDHHQFIRDFNSSKISFINAQDYCAAYLCFYLISSIKEIEHYDWLVACASISDFLFIKNEIWLKEIFEKYGDKFSIKEGLIDQNGKFWELQWYLSLAIIYSKESNLKDVYYSIGKDFGNMGDLTKSAKVVEDYIEESLIKFEEEKINLRNGFFWEFIPEFKVGSFISNMISTKYTDKTILIARPSDKHYIFSARRQDGKENMDLLLKSLTKNFKDADGGGHIKAAGGHVSIKDKEEFKKLLEIEIDKL